MPCAHPEVIHYRKELLRRVELWGNFPVEMRPFWLAQRGRCMICGDSMPLARIQNTRQPANYTTWEHVHPKSRTGRGRPKNKTLACHGCNIRKGNRLPYPCEVMFLAVVNEIVRDITG